MASEVHLTSLKRSAVMVRQPGVRCTYLKKKKSEIPGNRFEWLASRKEGYWIVRLFQRSVVDHFVLVDAFEKLMYDGEEHCPDSLGSCGGDEAKNLLVDEVRQLHFY